MASLFSTSFLILSSCFHGVLVSLVLSCRMIFSFLAFSIFSFSVSSSLYFIQHELSSLGLCCTHPSGLWKTEFMFW